MSRTKKKRKTLTLTERASLPGICEKWNRIALCTLPADRDEAERGAVDLYKAFGLKPPQEFIWFDSYQEAFEIHGSGHVLQPHLSPEKFSLLYTLDWVIDYGWDWAMNHFWARVLESVSNTISESVTFSWGLQQLQNAIGYIPQSNRNVEPPICYGQSDAQSFAFIDFFSNVIGPPYDIDISGLMRIVSSCGLFWPGLNKVAFFERPSLLRFDDRRRPHCLDGPAIQYPGGLTAYAIHGIPVPRKYIETPAEQIDLAEVLQERNAEVRMAVISRIGFNRLLEAVKPKNQIEQTCPHCAGRFNVVLPDQLPKHKPGTASKAVVVSTGNGNSLVEFTVGRSDRNRPRRDSDPEPLRLRLLHLTWQDKTGPKETVIPVPRTKRQFGRDCPEDINDCEQVRRWTLGWPKDVKILAET